VERDAAAGDVRQHRTDRGGPRLLVAQEEDRRGVDPAHGSAQQAPREPQGGAAAPEELGGQWCHAVLAVTVGSPVAPCSVGRSVARAGRPGPAPSPGTSPGPSARTTSWPPVASSTTAPTTAPTPRSSPGSGAQ